ncbi:MAG: hypothetical protein JWM59_948 [Verrucomicrobiales bacterium]|nr:hypothetical protein [Verrucomicrobiales bacterium]
MPATSFDPSGKAFTVWLDPACWPVAALKLPGNATSIWLEPARWAVAPLKPPGNPTSVRLDPGRWPVAPLKLPGNATAVWLDPARWPKAKLKLSAASAAFTHWLNPAAWPAVILRLPSAAFTYWLDPEVWSKGQAPTPVATASLVEPAPEAASVPVPVLEPLSLAAPVFLVDKPVIRVARSRAFTLWTKKAAEAVSPVAPTPIKLPGKAFTLWAKSTVSAPIPMRNGMTAAELEASNRRAAAAPAPRPVHPAHTAQPQSVPSASNRWLPLAAALALAALAGLKMVADRSTLANAEREKADLSEEVKAVIKTAKAEKEEKAARDQMLVLKAAEMEAQLKTLTEQNSKAASDLAAAQAAAAQASKAITEKATALDKAITDLEATKKEAFGTQSQMVTTTEEAARIKRAAAAEVVTLRESLGKLEAEKAAALRDAAQAAQDKASLQTALDALKKPAQ